MTCMLIGVSFPVLLLSQMIRLRQVTFHSPLIASCSGILEKQQKFSLKEQLAQLSMEPCGLKQKFISSYLKILSRKKIIYLQLPLSIEAIFVFSPEAGLWGLCCKGPEDSHWALFHNVSPLLQLFLC